MRERWGYSDEFMAWEPEAITVMPEHITDAITIVLESEERIIGFYVLQFPLSLMNGGGRGASSLEMSRLMIEPSAFGTGCGRLLWDHAVSTARYLGVSVITLDADPNAEPFYLRMGAETVGEHEREPPMMPGWRVKKMRFAIPS